MERMSDLETRLTAALQADGPPARDAVFRVEVLVRLERARFRRQVGRTVAVAAVLAVLVVVAAPAIAGWMAGDVQRLWIVMLTAAALSALPGLMVAPRVRSAAAAIGRLLYP